MDRISFTMNSSNTSRDTELLMKEPSGKEDTSDIMAIIEQMI